MYGPVENRLRESFWEELGSIKGLWDVPWCVGGDFSEILFPNERFRRGRFSNSMRRFSDVLNDLELRDLPLWGGGGGGGPLYLEGWYQWQFNVPFRQIFSHRRLGEPLQ